MAAPAWRAIAALERKGGRVFGFAWRWSVYKPLRRACAQAKVPYLSPHEFGRHTFATWMRQHAGMDLRGLMEAGGWRDPKSVARYAHVEPGEALKAVDMLPDVVKKPGSRPRNRRKTAA